jgi:hypothetical protein
MGINVQVCGVDKKNILLFCNLVFRKIALKFSLVGRDVCGVNGWAILSNDYLQISAFSSCSPL